MKSIRIIIVMLLCLAGAVAPARAYVGQWTAHAVFAAPPQKVIDTGSLVYYLSGGSLFLYDKKAQESRSYTMSTGLNDPTATDIFYNAAGGYLLIAYSSGNIDLLYNDGRIVNLSDISDSSIDPPLTINDVCFSGNDVFVATNFGLVQFNDNRHEVVQSGIYNTPVAAVTVADGHLIIWADGAVRSVELGSRFSSLAAFSQLVATGQVKQFIPAGQGEILMNMADSNPSLRLLTVDFSAGTASASRTVANHTPGTHLTVAADGRIYLLDKQTLYSLNPETFNEATVATLPDDFADAVAGTAEGASQVWTLTRSGLACHGFGSDGSVTLLTDRFRPEEFSVKTVCYLTPGADGRSLFVTNNGTTAYRFGRPGFAAYDNPLTASVIELDNGSFTDITPYPVEAYRNAAKGRQARVGKYLLSPTSIAQDPDDADVFYVSTSIDGLYKMKGTELEGIFSELNSPLFEFDARSIGYHVSVDRGGNLWLHTTSTAADASPIYVLPAAKRTMNPADIKPSDWICLNTKSLGYAGGQDVQVLHCTRSNMTFVSDHNPSSHFLAYDDRGTRTNFSDDKLKLWTRLIDQDGNIFSPSYVTAFCEDHDGAVWVGTDQGVIVITNPANATNDNMTIRRVKVPKNDGTNTAEYLLGTDLIYGITVDAANRKWIATERSGLFLVSADGTEILENFTEENSPLSSNLIYSVYANPYSSTIYVGTPEGLLSYESNATPAMPDFEKITVYPNPVTPDYSGPIYVKGLMDGSLVKIADASGTVLYQGRSEGGLFSWNACNSAGVRLPAGVYYVFASQNANDSSSGGTAKFMIIN
ncbi:MAG: hypothetical protein NC338_05700 [Firmicutes bacterium]|nr:hypothetical protein [Bacillota bacterium]MCM1401578.1 hypothetical protein [Bacteroides sp.]MCM1477462.1 hypothetical protein [Bacteroides sp.]